MNQFYIVIALVAAFAKADDEPFSIGLGVLSPSYSQTVGKENVKVNFEQKDNGFSYSVGDPTSGTKTFLNFGSAAGSQSINPAGYADDGPSALSGPSSSDYSGASPSAPSGPSPYGYTGPAASEYGAPQSNPMYSAFAGYQQPSISGYQAPVSGYQQPAVSGYQAPVSGYQQPSLAEYQQPSFGGYGSSGYGSPQNTYGVSNLYNGPSADAPSGFYGPQSARKPNEPSQILPAGFSYHGTEGQSFLNPGDESPNFMVSEGREEPRGPAQKSFQETTKPSSSGNVLVNGLVGYGSGGQRGSLPVGGYAGPQFAGLVKEHGGHE